MGAIFLISDTTRTDIENLLDASDATGNPYSDHLEKLFMSDASDRLPPLNALRAFEAAARRLSFTQAAEELNVTPGAISQQIRQLEDFAGTPLFKRTGRSVLLTDAAQASLPLVREAFEKISEAGRVMQAPARKGRVMISSAPSFAAKWLAPRLESFHRANEGIEAWISADMSLTDFNTADADIAIRYGRGNYDGLKSEKLLDEMVLPVCSPRLPCRPVKNWTLLLASCWPVLNVIASARCRQCCRCPKSRPRQRAAHRCRKSLMRPMDWILPLKRPCSASLPAANPAPR